VENSLVLAIALATFVIKIVEVVLKVIDVARPK
jgi:hypothetical protein